MRLPILLLFIPVLCSAAAPPQHPRLYLNPQRITQLREEITTFRKAHWDVIRVEADQLARRHPPVYERAILDNDAEQLWQRNVGNALPTLAIAWVLTGDNKYRKAVTEWAMASCSYPNWGHPEKNPGKDLAAGHQLFGLALVYDWMYQDLDPQVRETIHKALLERGRTMFAATDPKTGNFWRNEYMQNHLWVNATGLTAAALAISEEPETAQWLEVTRDEFRRSDEALGSDGASHEGAGYWTYGVEYLLKYWALSADLMGEDLKAGWWQKTAMYRLYIGLPTQSLANGDTIVPIADCTGKDYRLSFIQSRAAVPRSLRPVAGARTGTRSRDSRRRAISQLAVVRSAAEGYAAIRASDAAPFRRHRNRLGPQRLVRQGISGGLQERSPAGPRRSGERFDLRCGNGARASGREPLCGLRQWPVDHPG